MMTNGKERSLISLLCDSASTTLLGLGFGLMLISDHATYTFIYIFLLVILLSCYS